MPQKTHVQVLLLIYDWLMVSNVIFITLFCLLSARNRIVHRRGENYVVRYFSLLQNHFCLYKVLGKICTICSILFSFEKECWQNRTFDVWFYLKKLIIVYDVFDDGSSQCPSQEPPARPQPCKNHSCYDLPCVCGAYTNKILHDFNCTLMGQLTRPALTCLCATMENHLRPAGNCSTSETFRPPLQVVKGWYIYPGINILTFGYLFLLTPCRCLWDGDELIWVAVNQDRQSRRKRPVLFSTKSKKFMFDCITLKIFKWLLINKIAMLCEADTTSMVKMTEIRGAGVPPIPLVVN